MALRGKLGLPGQGAPPLHDILPPLRNVSAPDHTLHQAIKVSLKCVKTSPGALMEKMAYTHGLLG